MTLPSCIKTTSYVNTYFDAVTLIEREAESVEFTAWFGDYDAVVLCRDDPRFDEVIYHLKSANAEKRYEKKSPDGAIIAIPYIRFSRMTFIIEGG